MKLEEAMKLAKIHYSGTRENYDINDENPNILILDKNYKDDSILAFNLNYLDDKGKKSLIKKIQKFDDKIVNLKKTKAFLLNLFNKGYYNLSKDDKILRYQELVNKFPELKKCIRRYKFSGIGAIKNEKTKKKLSNRHK